MASKMLRLFVYLAACDIQYGISIDVVVVDRR